MKAAVIFDNFGPYPAARLRAAAHTCDLLAIQVHARSADYAWQPLAEVQGFRAVTLLNPMIEGDASLRARLADALGKFGPDVVFVPGWSSRAAWAAWQWCARQGVPAVCMSESTAWDDHRCVWRERIKRRFLRLGSAAFAGGTPHAVYLTALGLSPDRVFLGYDAVDNAHFQHEAEEARRQATAFRARYRLPENYFLASARFIARKNLAGLIQAYARYRRDAAESKELWSLVLLGGGPLAPDLRRLISELSLERCVHLPGFRQYDELPIYYGLAGGFVHASASEPWGLVVNEAMASGLPVLVSRRCGCCQDLVADGENGFAFDPFNMEQLARLMGRMAGMRTADREQFGARSREIIEHWGPSRFTEGWRQAADCALRVGPKRASALDYRLLGCR
jgi:glycosyltransferase involved in cell wall biosynthesis